MTKPTAKGSSHIQQEAPVSKDPTTAPEGLPAPDMTTETPEPQSGRGAWLAFLVWGVMFVVLCLQAFLDLIISLFR